MNMGKSIARGKREIKGKVRINPYNGTRYARGGIMRAREGRHR